MVLVVPGHGRWAGEVGAEWRRLVDEDAAPAAFDRPKHQMSSRAPADDESDTDPVRGDSEPGHRARAGGQADADLHRLSRGARWYRPDAPRAVDLARDPDIADAVPAGRGELRPGEPAVQVPRRGRCVWLRGCGKVLGVNRGRGPGDAGQVVLVLRDCDLVQPHLARACLAVHGCAARPLAEHPDGVGVAHVVEVRGVTRARYVASVFGEALHGSTVPGRPELPVDLE